MTELKVQSNNVEIKTKKMQRQKSQKLSSNNKVHNTLGLASITI